MPPVFLLSAYLCFPFLDFLFVQLGLLSILGSKCFKLILKSGQLVVPFCGRKRPEGID
jgi:hypothetical protein